MAEAESANNAEEEEELLSARLGWLGRVDTAVYNVEKVVVVTALIVMSIMVFTDVLYQSVVGVMQSLGETSSYLTAFGFLVFTGIMAYAATGPSGVDADTDEPSEPRSVFERLGIATAVNIGIAAFCWVLLAFESSTVYRLILVAFLAPVAHLFWTRREFKNLVIIGISGVLAAIGFGLLPTGFSWSQSYSLLLLLWVGFLGASMAARQRRHLRIDLARKLLPPKWLPHFNAASYLVAAAFTAIVFYLGYIYMFGADSTYLRPIWEAPSWLPESLQEELTTGFPLPDDASFFRRALQVVFVPTEPGEIPDYLKVLAIPVSLALIFLRFLGHVFVFVRMAIRGEEFSESMGTH